MSDSGATIRRRTVLSGVGAAVVGLAGCSGGQGTPKGTATGGTTKVTVAALWSGGEEKTFQKVLDYVESQANVTIEYHPRSTDSLKTGTLMDYQSEVAPADVVVMPWPARIRSDASKGHLATVGGTWKPTNYAVAPDQVTVDGSVYGAPFKMDLKPGYWYRKSFFNEHGLSEPKNYDEFLSLLKKLSGIDGVNAPMASGNGTGWPLGDQTEGYFLRQNKGAKLQKGLISGDADFTDSRVKGALEEEQRLLQKGYFSTMREFAVQYQYFWDNKLPLYFMGSWTPTMDAIKDPSDLGVFRLPGVKGIVASINWLTVPKYSNNKGAARTVVDLITSKKGQRTWVEQGGFIASHSGIPADAYKLTVMAELSDLAAKSTLVPDLDDALGSPFQGAFWAQMKGLWSEPSSSIGDIVSRLEKKQNASLEK